MDRMIFEMHLAYNVPAVDMGNAATHQWWENEWASRGYDVGGQRESPSHLHYRLITSIYSFLECFIITLSQTCRVPASLHHRSITKYEESKQDCFLILSMVLLHTPTPSMKAVRFRPRVPEALDQGSRCPRRFPYTIKFRSTFNLGGENLRTTFSLIRWKLLEWAKKD